MYVIILHNSSASVWYFSFFCCIVLSHYYFFLPFFLSFFPFLVFFMYFFINSIFGYNILCFIVEMKERERHTHITKTLMDINQSDRTMDDDDG